MACVAVNSLITTIELEFLQPHPRPILQDQELIACNKDLIQSLHQKLGLLIELFDENRMDGIQAIKDLEKKLRDVAFRVEDEIELQIANLYKEAEEEEEEESEEEEAEEEEEEAEEEKETVEEEESEEEGNTNLEKTCHPCKLCHILEQAIQDIDVIKEELVKYKHFIALQGSKTTLDASTKRGDIIMTGDSSKHASHSKDIMVGKDNDFQIVKKMLIEHLSKQREIVSIMGMGGIGKTTLARRIYEDPSIISHFDKRLWVVASQHHNKRQMLLGLLDLKDNANNSTDGELKEKLYQSLKGQRYLVVIDDVWSGEAWDALQACFSDEENGSRVLLTTRIAEIANHTCSKDAFSHQMQLLEQSESWELFYQKACKSRSAEFEIIGRPVVEKCKGLPLAIIVVAGLFSKLNTLEEWKNTANTLSSSSTTTLDDEECSRILSFSYNHLPHKLKACFLYLGVFPEDHQIKASNLARLWFAEGLVKEFENESFDAVANRYIQELMDRNLIILSMRSSCGRKIKSFRMHDLLHAFCVREAQNENLLHVVMSENNFDFPQKSFRWVSIQSGNFKMSTIRSHSKSCRSFLYFPEMESSLDLRNCNLLRVFYHNYDFLDRGRLKKVVDIVHLRFLICGKIIKLFLKSRCKKNIEQPKAWNLQTLYCHELSYRADNRENYSEFPQLHNIYCAFFHENSPYFVRNLCWLISENCSKGFIVNVPNLKKVGIRGESRDCNDCITNLAYLEQLEGLYIWGDGHIQAPINNHIARLKNLRKLLFLNMGFEWKEISVLSKLPSLEVLKLRYTSCKVEEWEIPEEVIFCKLISLEIFSCNLKHWKASIHNFPELEYLFLRECSKLKEIPIDFAEILTLKSIELSDCLPFAVKSAKKIRDEQHEYGNYNMVVIEKNTIKDSQSEESQSEEETEVEN